MRVAPIVIVLVRDAAGFGGATAAAIRPKASAGLKRELTQLNLSLEKYGVSASGDDEESVELFSLVDANQSPQVSILVIPNYAPPVAACAINEILKIISADKQSPQPKLVIPCVVKPPHSNFDANSKVSSKDGILLYGAEIGPTTELTTKLIDGTVEPSPSLQIHVEATACLIAMVPVLMFPAVLLVATSSQWQSKSSTENGLELLYKIGDHLASHLPVELNLEALQGLHVERLHVAREPWRELYR